MRVIVSTDDITTEEGVTNMLKTANSLGPVAGIFNLAVVSIHLSIKVFEFLEENLIRMFIGFEGRSVREPNGGRLPNLFRREGGGHTTPGQNQSQALSGIEVFRGFLERLLRQGKCRSDELRNV